MLQNFVQTNVGLVKKHKTCEKQRDMLDEARPVSEPSKEEPKNWEKTLFTYWNLRRWQLMFNCHQKFIDKDEPVAE